MGKWILIQAMYIIGFIIILISIKRWLSKRWYKSHYYLTIFSALYIILKYVSFCWIYTRKMLVSNLGKNLFLFLLGSIPDSACSSLTRLLRINNHIVQVGIGRGWRGRPETSANMHSTRIHETARSQLMCAGARAQLYGGTTQHPPALRIAGVEGVVFHIEI